MKPPLRVEKHLHESGLEWWLRDASGQPVAQGMNLFDAEMVAWLVNRDYEHNEIRQTEYTLERMGLMPWQIKKEK